MSCVLLSTFIILPTLLVHNSGHKDGIGFKVFFLIHTDIFLQVNSHNFTNQVTVETVLRTSAQLPKVTTYLSVKCFSERVNT